MKTSKKKRKKVCDSLYHNKLFRFMLVLVGIDMITLGFSFALGFDFLSLSSHLSIPFRVIFGMMYVLVALFIVHYALAYRDFLKKSHLVCHHCLDK